MPKIKFTIITLFREALEPYLSTSMMWKAVDKGIAEFDFVNLRDFGLGPHRSVDDTPYGGGDGMLLRPEPVFSAIESVKAKDKNAKVIIPTPAGDLWTQSWARTLAGLSISKETSTPVSEIKSAEFYSDNTSNTTSITQVRSAEQSSDNSDSSALSTPVNSLHYIILCPHYEGYDERILSIVDYKFSLGHYVLTGGELPALIIIDSIVRLIPGVLGGETSALIESFSDGDNIEYPQYTKPYDFRGMTVPDILLSGNHGQIASWRKENSKKAL